MLSVTERLLLVGSLLASVTAFAAFVLTVTKTARLRRREQMLRESMAVFAKDGPHHAMLLDLHRAVVADLVGRQLTPPWRVVWPWLAWATVLLLNAQSGFLGARYLAQEGKASWTGFGLAVLGDLTLAPVLPLMALLILSWIFFAHVYTLLGRAEMTRKFYDGISVGRPETYSDAMTAAELRELQFAFGEKRGGADGESSMPSRSWRDQGRAAFSGGRMWLMSVVPGIFVVFMGYFIGINYWLSDTSRGAANFKRIEPLGSIVVLGTSLAATAMVWVWTEVYMALREHALPLAHAPKSKLVVSKRRHS